MSIYVCFSISWRQLFKPVSHFLSLGALLIIGKCSTNCYKLVQFCLTFSTISCLILWSLLVLLQVLNTRCADPKIQSSLCSYLHVGQKCSHLKVLYVILHPCGIAFPNIWKLHYLYARIFLMYLSILLPVALFC